jgi:hypothetical protein
VESTARTPVKKSARVVLTVAAAMSMSVRGQQPVDLQAADPCASATFNGNACQVAVRHQGYCEGSTWVNMTYQQRYPYYYDSYQTYLAAGGVATAAVVGNCRFPRAGLFGALLVPRGGFGSIGAGRHAGS